MFNVSQRSYCLRSLVRRLSTSSSVPKNFLSQHLESLIQTRGPMSVSSWMKEVLTNPFFGYYMKGDVFGREGDFITSPDISPIFGELLGIWCVGMWESIGSPCPLKLIEFGPGRGTLMADLLRALTPFPQLKSAISVNFIEISPFLRKLQASTLGLTYPDSPAYLHGKRTGLRIPLREGEDSSIIVNTSLTRKDGIQVSWTQSLTDVPPGPSIIIAHEFFDALPVHQFELTKEGWRERLIGLHPHCSNGENFCFIQSPSPTVASRGLLRKEFYPELPVFNEEKNILIEVSAEGLALG
eukprot:TRINITY_DN1908_c0_g2_i8.p1 TRINITY_DN1908_c0_g2~~TRINITY_DN1908_c0_g2_i8.p1  ORF type:complete len:297 (+),score=40.46 TRINITY_DN1908_c0_g2_i8:75-965(+)